MKDEDKTKEQLIDELTELRQQVADLKAAHGERIQAHQALRDSEARYRNLVDSMLDAVLIVNDEARFLDANPAACELLGYSRDELLGLSVEDISLPANRSLVQQLWNEFIAAGTFAGEYTVVCKDGRIRETEFRAVANIQPNMHLSVLRDITKRKQMEKTLRESEKHYRKAEEIAHFGSWERDFINNTAIWSPEAYHIYGLDPGDTQLTYDTFLNLVHPSDRKRVEQAVSLAWSNHKPMDIEYRIVHPDRTVHTVHSVAEVRLNQAGEVIGLVGTIQDITERKQVEEVLRRQEQEFRSLAETLPDIVTRFDRQLRHLYMNPQIEEVGLSAHTFLGKTNRELGMPEELVDRWDAALTEVFESGRSRMIEFTFPSPNGPAYYESRIVPEWAPDGSVQTVLTIARNVTERKRAEEKLQRYTHRLEILHQIDRAILTAQSPEEIAQAALGHIRQMVPCTRASVSVFDLEAQTAMRIALQIDGETSFGLGQNFLLEKEEVEELQKGKVRQVPDILASSQPLSQKPKLLLADEGFRSFINVPLVVEDKLVGSLNLGRDSVGHFDQEYIEIAQEVANSLAVAIQNARLAESEQVQHGRQSALLAVARVLGSTLDLREELQILLDHLHRIVPYDAATVQLLEGDSLRTAATAGFEDQTAVRSFVYTMREFPLNRQLIEKKQPIYIDDVRNDVRYIVIPGSEAVRTFMGVPLLVKGESVGLITLDSYTPARFSQNDIDLVVAVAAYAAVAIENARLFEAEHAGRERLRHLSQQLVQVQEAERRHIARELHDEIGQALTGLKLILDMVPRPSSKIDETESKLSRAQALVDQIMTQVHDLSLDLRPPMLDDLGLLPALLWYFERFTAQSGVRVNFKHKGVMNRRFATQVETAVYRIVQEALTNIARHASVSEATVRVLASKQTLHLQIIDQGVGFDPAAALVASDRNGLAGMQERVSLLGGHFEIESTGDTGTSVIADFSITDASQVIS